MLHRGRQLLKERKRHILSTEPRGEEGKDVVPDICVMGKGGDRACSPEVRGGLAEGMEGGGWEPGEDVAPSWHK